jgi:hypothetical protein
MQERNRLERKVGILHGLLEKTFDYPAVVVQKVRDAHFLEIFTDVLRGRIAPGSSHGFPGRVVHDGRFREPFEAIESKESAGVPHGGHEVADLSKAGAATDSALDDVTTETGLLAIPDQGPQPCGMARQKRWEEEMQSAVEQSRFVAQEI